eukprot:6182942-Pyramimonas_sp.AAC.1
MGPRSVVLGEWPPFECSHWGSHWSSLQGQAFGGAPSGAMKRCTGRRWAPYQGPLAKNSPPRVHTKYALLRIPEAGSSIQDSSL